MMQDKAPAGKGAGARGSSQGGGQSISTIHNPGGEGRTDWVSKSGVHRIIEGLHWILEELHRVLEGVHSTSMRAGTVDIGGGM